MERIGEGMKAVDIVIPIYNEPVEVVRATVEAVKHALGSVKGVTIILVDDGSDSKYERALMQLPHLTAKARGLGFIYVGMKDFERQNLGIRPGHRL